jgi:hypothetical protein
LFFNHVPVALAISDLFFVLPHSVLIVIYIAMAMIYAMETIETILPYENLSLKKKVGLEVLK